MAASQAALLSLTGFSWKSIRSKMRGFRQERCQEAELYITTIH